MANASDPWAQLRFRRRPKPAQKTHPIYVARELSKEHALLETLVEMDPPFGGMAAYIADLNRIPTAGTGSS